MADHEAYTDWRSLELAIKDAAKRAAREAGPGVNAATVDAQIRQARFDRFLSRVFADGERSEWLLKGGMSVLVRVPRSRTTKDLDLASHEAGNLADPERALTGKRTITTDTALRLSKALGVDDRFWINIQTDFDLEVERDLHGDELAKVTTLVAS